MLTILVYLPPLADPGEGMAYESLNFFNEVCTYPRCLNEFHNMLALIVCDVFIPPGDPIYAST